MTELRNQAEPGEAFPALNSNGQLPSPRDTPDPGETWAHDDGAQGDVEALPSAKDTPNGNGMAKENKHERNKVEDKEPQLNGTSPLNATRDAKENRQEPATQHVRRKSSIASPRSPRSSDADKNGILKLSPQQIQELTSSPTSLPTRPADPLPEQMLILEESPLIYERIESGKTSRSRSPDKHVSPTDVLRAANGNGQARSSGKAADQGQQDEIVIAKTGSGHSRSARPSMSSRTVSTPPVIRRKHSSRGGLTPSVDAAGQQKNRPVPLNLEEKNTSDSNSRLKPSSAHDGPVPSPMPPSIPLPPLSIPTYLQLELSSERPSPLYIHRPAVSDFPYESSRIKFERLVNFLILPFELEQSLGFGALACLDAWLYTFTILPLRFLKAIWILAKWWTTEAWKEVHGMATVIYLGTGRWWKRRQMGAEKTGPNAPKEVHETPKAASFPLQTPPSTNPQERTPSITIPAIAEPPSSRRSGKNSVYRHRRLKSVPSALLPNHKADLLKGLLVISTCLVLMRFDASRTYHNIRGQAAIKLYVIYNVLEVCDRLFSALGQDILECLLSRETLDRNEDGRSKVIRPFWMFLLALAYNSIHATALFYQVITLNVAVNSYSNALLTLLMSNQFVEIKGTVFKKFEKENLFQLTCADMVERFQLWLMLMIIALRNIVEVGGLTILGDVSSSTGSGGLGGNGTSAPFRSPSIIPKSFTIFPKWTGQVLGPFLLVLGSEMLVDWLKHAYITKFNNTKPTIYGRFLDVLSKDYYSHAFSDQNLTKRLGLPVLPLACLFIRATMQTYHMFLATHMPLPIPSSATGLSVDESASASSPATTAALAHIDHIFRRALGRSSFGAGVAGAPSFRSAWTSWSLDDAIAFATMVVFFLVVYFVLLALKLVLGMVLLSFARSRYRGMKERERMGHTTDGKRIGGWGVTEVDEDKKRWIYADDPEGFRALREREEKQKRKDRDEKDGGTGVLEATARYSMVAKRIW
ncbi:eukaryotic membrane protein family-domain-containing protein [Phyllosticta citrichinensis]|uniref:Eukaryotic membrane protein family-domain-containing protein n=1 Tax=Phyllosticta citrichinensis TaxID=1130410 RepID=A0ABR1Y6Y0_9PEZI